LKQFLELDAERHVLTILLYPPSNKAEAEVADGKGEGEKEPDEKDEKGARGKEAGEKRAGRKEAEEKEAGEKEADKGSIEGPGCLFRTSRPFDFTCTVESECNAEAGNMAISGR